MADEFDQNKTEDPTPRRRQRAREEGDVVHSPDLTAGFVLLGVALALRTFGETLTVGLTEPLRETLTGLRATDWGVAETHLAGRWLTSRFVLLSASVFGIVLLLSLLVTQIQTGLTFTWVPLAPKWERLSPAQGRRRLFSMESVVRGGMAVVKLATTLIVAWGVLTAGLPAIRASARGPFGPSLAEAGSVLGQLLLGLALATLAWGAADYAFRRYRYEQRLRMSKQEIKDEHKEDNGDPMIRARIRRAQQRLAQERTLRLVPEATLVVTNPTHFAVALKYREGQMSAPVVVAKGADAFALRIIDTARRHGVPVFERKPLARAVYALADVGDEIPPEFYRAIAELLARVYRLKQAA